MLPRALRPAVSAFTRTATSPRTATPHAEEVADHEREAVWAMLEASRPGYRGYERLSGRRIRLFRLLPR